MTLKLKLVLYIFEPLEEGKCIPFRKKRMNRRRVFALKFGLVYFFRHKAISSFYFPCIFIFKVLIFDFTVEKFMTYFNKKN